MKKLIDFLQNSLTSYHAVENAANMLDSQGFCRLSERHDWSITEGGKYYVARGGALIAFTIGSLNDFSYKIVAAHTDSPALKLKENPLMKSGAYAKLNVETYGGGIWYSFFDRPLKIAGRIIRKDNARLREETVTSPFTVSIPSVAIHQSRDVNNNFSVDLQTDLLPLLSLSDGIDTSAALIEQIAGENVISYDLFLVNADMPYSFGINDEFLASPRIDNLTSVFASLEALTFEEEHGGICVAAMFDHEEIGSGTNEGAEGDFLENVLRRIAYALRFDDLEYYKALSSSFLLSLDNAHATHPNHPEKSDPTNKTVMGGGIVIKNHAKKAYVTDAVASAVLQTIFDNANVKHQAFYNHSNARSGSTLGAAAIRTTGMMGADAGIAQLAMHSSNECFAKADYDELVKGLLALYSATIVRSDEDIQVL